MLVLVLVPVLVDVSMSLSLAVSMAFLWLLCVGRVVISWKFLFYARTTRGPARNL